MKTTTVVRVGVSAGAVALASLPAFLMPACLSSSATNDGGTGGSSSSSSGGSSSGSSSGVPTDDGGGTTEAGGNGLCNLDDMSSTATITGGYWFTFSDRTCDNTANLKPAAAGMMNPVEGYPFDPMPSTVTIPSLGTVNYREATGGGENVWGAGFGFNLLNNGSDPFTTCTFPACTGTPPANDAGAGFPAKYDASAHKGISFWTMAPMATATAPLKARVQLSDSHTDPGSGIPGATAASSMVCDPCSTATVNSGNRCANDFYQAITIGPTWTQQTVMFSTIKTDTWTKSYGAGKFDPTTLYHVHIQLNGSATAPVPNFDIQVACVSWVDGP